MKTNVVPSHREGEIQHAMEKLIPIAPVNCCDSLWQLYCLQNLLGSKGVVITQAPQNWTTQDSLLGILGKMGSWS